MIIVVNVHESIAIGLATELRAFCKHAFGDQWFEWEWSNRMVRVEIENGRINIKNIDPSVIFGRLDGGISYQASGKIGDKLIVRCDLAHPKLVEILREKLFI